MGIILEFSATGFIIFLIGRVVNGIGNGLTSTTCGMYQAESCHGQRRGKLSIIIIMHSNLFYAIGTSITLGCSKFNDDLQWRVPLVIQLFPCVVMVSLLWILPESPRWLLIRNKKNKARESLRRYMGHNLDPEDNGVINELNSIEGSIIEERSSKTSFTDILFFRDRYKTMKRLLLGCGLQLIQQIITVQAAYFPLVFTENLKLGRNLSRILFSANAVSLLFFSVLSFWMIETCGRRFLMITGLLIQFVAYVVAAVSVAFLDRNPTLWSSLSVTALFIAKASFACFWGAVPWIYQSEVIQFYSNHHF